LLTRYEHPWISIFRTFDRKIRVKSVQPATNLEARKYHQYIMKFRQTVNKLDDSKLEAKKNQIFGLFDPHHVTEEEQPFQRADE
jgi:hypothetical protein